MIKDLFSFILLIVVKPEQAWRITRRRTPAGDDLRKRVFFPALGILTLSAFVGHLLNAPHTEVSAAMKSAAVYILIALSAFYLNMIAMPMLAKGILRLQAGRRRWEAFILHSYAPIYLLTVAYLLLPQMIILNILMLYTVYIVWQGCVHYWELPEEKLFPATVIFSLCLFVLSMGTGILLSHIPLLNTP